MDSEDISMTRMNTDQKHADAFHEERMEKIDRNGDVALKFLGDDVEPITEEEEKRVLRKIDWRLVPVMMLVNSVQLIDKNVSPLRSVATSANRPQTLGAAALYGLIQQANLKGQEYSMLVALFYIGYLVAEYPSNYLMQKFPTGKYLTVNFILWGKHVFDIIHNVLIIC